MEKGTTMTFDTELCEIAYKYGTDKCPQISHNYTPFYYNLLKDKRHTIKKVFEMGIYNGASLRMWRDFFPNAQIFGADIVPEQLFTEDRIQTFQCDQLDESQVKALIERTGSDIDLFIDDGSHNTRHQVQTCLAVMPLLKKDVTYIIEDVRITHRVLPHVSVDYAAEMFDFNRNRHHDNRLVVVKNK